MKNLHRPIPKSKILEGLKKSTTLSSSTMDKTMNASANISSARKTTPSSLLTKTSATTQARKSIVRKIGDEKPKNTIRSMFQKQLEKSRTAESPQMDNEINPTVIELYNEEQSIDSISTSLVTGSLHKRLTRRNSITVQTPTKTAPKLNANIEISSVPSNVKKRRCTMFIPSKISFDEEEEEEDTTRNKTTITQDKSNQDGNRTVNKTVEMEICNGPSNDEANKSNSKVRQLLNTELMKTSRDIRTNGLANMFAPSNVSVRRRTTYTPQHMDETKVQNSTSVTPMSLLTQRRKTMNVNANVIVSSPRSAAKITAAISDALTETKSCDAVLTPTNKTITGKIALSFFSNFLL